jgi:hypothetical protein
MTCRIANRLAPVLRATTSVALLAVVTTGAVNAHPGGPEEIIVVGDHVDPGQTFRLLASFIEPAVEVTVTVVTGSTVFDLGSVTVDAAGSFDVSLTLPPEVPHGYAELHLSQPNEGDAATVFLIGPRDGSTPAAPAVAGGSVFESQAGALVLFVGTLVGIAVIGSLLIRSGRRPTI